MKPAQYLEIGSFFSEVEQFLREIARVPLDKEKEERRLRLEEQLSRFRNTPRVLRKSSSAPMSNRPIFVRDTVDINGCLVPLIRARRSSYPPTKLGFSPLPKVKEEEEDQLKKNVVDKTKPKQDLKIPKIYVMHYTELNNQVDFHKFIENGARVPVASGGRPRSNTFPRTFPRANHEAETKTNELTAQYACPRRKPDSSYIRLVSSLGLNGNCTAGSSEAHASPKKRARDIGWCMVCN